MLPGRLVGPLPAGQELKHTLLQVLLKDLKENKVSSARSNLISLQISFAPTGDEFGGEGEVGEVVGDRLKRIV